MERRVSAIAEMAAILVARPDASTTQRFNPAVGRQPIVKQSQMMGLRPGSALSSHGFRSSR